MQHFKIMYKIRNIVYSEPGYILVGNNRKGYQFEGDVSEFTEHEISLDDMQVNGEFVTYDGILQYIGSNPDYSKLKGDMVKRRYSNDDQIAIMLNDDTEAMQRMQAWRDWSTRVATKILELINT